MHRKIIVGYDGSSYSHAALDWALDEAARTAAPVHIIYADEWPVLAPAASMVPSPALRPESYVVDVINGTLEHAVARAKKIQPLVDVTSTVIRAHAAPALIDLSKQAQLIVLGARGHSAVGGLLGSVSSAVTAHAHCPVVVVRGEAAADAPVVAGVDGSAMASPVLAFAAAQAAERKVPLRVIRAWPPVTGLWEETPMVTNKVTDHEREPFDTLVTVIRDEYPDLVVEAEATVAHPAAVLTRASTGAQLLVVGSRGHGAFSGLLLGSVSQHLLRHSACTVAVVHREI
ncbi:universal stress protein [Actinoplanes sp. NPDC024001]|uniref:universal stress protein n=1 Tax=Actinoplanes sp. NPDC024001 TaxID=3154598 RepID=UPI00340A1A8A